MSVSKTLPPPEETGMEYRFLGPTGLAVSTLSFGGWVNADDEKTYEPTKACFIEAWKAGINLYDLAEGYNAGACERCYGRILKELEIERTSIVITTKIFFGYGLNHPNHKGNSYKHVIEAMD